MIPSIFEAKTQGHDEWSRDEKSGSMSDEVAHDYKRELVASKRYVRDVY